MLRLPILIFNALSNFSNGEACCNIRQNWKTLKKTKTIECWDTTAQKMNFSIKDFLSKCDEINRKLWIWSHLLETADLVTFTKEMLNEKLLFLRSAKIFGFLWIFLILCRLPFKSNFLHISKETLSEYLSQFSFQHYSNRHLLVRSQQ